MVWIKVLYRKSSFYTLKNYIFFPGHTKLSKSQKCIRLTLSIFWVPCPVCGTQLQVICSNWWCKSLKTGHKYIVPKKLGTLVFKHSQTAVKSSFTGRYLTSQSSHLYVHGSVFLAGVWGWTSSRSRCTRKASLLCGCVYGPSACHRLWNSSRRIRTRTGDRLKTQSCHNSGGSHNTNTQQQQQPIIVRSRQRLTLSLARHGMVQM